MSRKKRRTAGHQPTGVASAPTSASAAGGESAEERRARQIREWEARKKQKERKASQSVTPWVMGGAAVLLAAVVGAVVLLSGGDSSGSGAPVVTPDPRVAGLPIGTSVEVVADDDGQATNPRFVPSEIVAQAGEVLEIQLANEGSVAHNLTVSGLDREYDTRDDFTINALDAGESGTLLVKLDEPGTYPFRCDLHPVQQVGNLILN